jgi:CopG family nickel-responsive transcriptional regulator
MQNDLVRFGVAMDRPLLERFDAIVAERGVTRSEILRDLVRAEVARSQVKGGAPAVATLTLVYDHHVRELTEKLTEFQHQLGEGVRSTLHIHLDHDRCLEVIVMRGRSDELKRVADRMLATRGVTHGGLELIADEDHDHDHGGHGHTHAKKAEPSRRVPRESRGNGAPKARRPRRSA